MAKPEIETLLGDTVEEIKAMGKQGMDHPSTKPVLTGGAIGAVAGAVLPVISWPVGLFAGAAIALYSRIRR
ncbi:hypothetical protein [Sphingopyxis sp. GW247-27LB]|uniref:hypothetical protein n=1 Tax=Sphingopyxis sp. GW247-27LB TaxID=2012632 RepID=UPI000BA4F124|nr:hypothetical protein [Sphingopyxis sp. GW247-27LB]PAL25172.1 hypothetical protein CD928_01285 [Sphingopyxis sp. GW247-27LB]